MRQIWLAMAVAVIVTSDVSAQEDLTSRVSEKETVAPAVEAELAPRDLGELYGKDVLIAAAGDGREIYVYNPEDTTVKRFTEKGQVWGDPISLQIDSLQKSITFIRMDMNDGRLVLSGFAGLAVFTAPEGYLLSQHQVFQPADVAGMPFGEYAAALINVPLPSGEGFLARSAFGDEVPRLVVYDDEGEVEASGLIEESQGPRDASRAVARALRLSWGDGSLWAAEVGSYLVMELDQRLEVIRQLHDPEFDYGNPTVGGKTQAAEGKDADTSEGAVEDDTGFIAARDQMKSTGQDLANQQEVRPPVSVRVQFAPVVVDLDWGPKPGQVYWLLDPKSFKGKYLLERLDPITGEIRRTVVTVPEFEGSLTQIATGARYVWLRGYSKDSPIFRVDRAQLDEGLLLALKMSRSRPEIDVAVADDGEADGE